MIQRRYNYSSTRTQPRPYKGAGEQCHAPAYFPLGKTRYPLHRRLGGLWGHSGPGWKNSYPRGSNPKPSSPQRVAIPNMLEAFGSTFTQGPKILTGQCRGKVFSQDTVSFRHIPRDSSHICSSYYSHAQSAVRGQHNTVVRATVLCCPQRHSKQNKYFNHFHSKAEIERQK